MTNLIQLYQNEDGTLSYFSDVEGPLSPELADKAYPFFKSLIPELRRRVPPYAGPHPQLAQALLSWRRGLALAQDVPAYFIMHQKLLYAIADAAPQTEGELRNLPGFGPSRFEKYGLDILRITASYAPEE